MSLIQLAKLNGLDPDAYLNDVLQRLQTHKVHFVAELLPHRWQPLPSAHWGALRQGRVSRTITDFHNSRKHLKRHSIQNRIALRHRAQRPVRALSLGDGANVCLAGWLAGWLAAFGKLRVRF